MADEFLDVSTIAGSSLATVGEDASVTSSSPYSVAWSSDGKEIAVSSQDYDLALAQAPDSSSKNSITKLTATVPAFTSAKGVTTKYRPLSWSPDSLYIAVGNTTAIGKVTIWQAATTKNVLTLDAGSSPLTSVQWVGSNLIVTGSLDGTVKFWQLS